MHHRPARPPGGRNAHPDELGGWRVVLTIGGEKGGVFRCFGRQPTLTSASGRCKGGDRGGMTNELTDVEVSYRRGYQEGAFAAIEAAVKLHGRPAALPRLRDWAGVTLSHWRYLNNPDKRFVRPPTRTLPEVAQISKTTRSYFSHFDPGSQWEARLNERCTFSKSAAQSPDANGKTL
jgi:hypothetical protein